MPMLIDRTYEVVTPESADGYMDCTDWSYSRNLRTLKRELRDMYGE